MTSEHESCPGLIHFYNALCTLGIALLNFICRNNMLEEDEFVEAPLSHSQGLQNRVIVN